MLKLQPADRCWHHAGERQRRPDGRSVLSPPDGPAQHMAAIAYSQADGRYGFFWGADKRDEAEANALRHCADDGGSDCSVVTTFPNHRQWGDDDGSGFSYNSCGALAVSEKPVTGQFSWGAKSARTRREAATLSLRTYEAGGGRCEIREWVCT